MTSSSTGTLLSDELTKENYDAMRNEIVTRATARVNEHFQRALVIVERIKRTGGK